jgi:hypothetical protein
MALKKARVDKAISNKEEADAKVKENAKKRG